MNTVKSPASDAEAKQVRTELSKASGVTVKNWFRDGPGDSIKINVVVDGKNFTIAVETLNDLPVMDANFKWTYGLNNVKAVVAHMKS